MGRVRTNLIKKAAKVIIERFYARLTHDFDTNKRVVDEVTSTIPSKRIRNKIAGFVTHLMKRIQKGPVRGVSLKVQEEERERRMDFIPEQSELDVPQIAVDNDTYNMLRSLNFPAIQGVNVSADADAKPRREQRGRKGGQGDRGQARPKGERRQRRDKKEQGASTDKPAEAPAKAAEPTATA
jgi:small subunit ribosomal protein S17e